jgi:DNA polymerase-1
VPAADVAPLLLVDAPFFLYRAFHSLPSSIKGKDGKPVGALLGSANAILAAAEEHRARAVVTCFGPDAAEYRVELFDGYHAQRPPVPGPLASQWEKTPILYQGLGWEVATSRDMEADDLLGSYAAKETDAGGRTLIFTGDRDMFQCANDTVTVLLAARGGPQLVDAAEVEKRYGIPPELVPDFIALRGDPSDGIPGAKGVGEKTAADILRRHGSLEAALEAAPEGTQLHSQRDQLLDFKKIATLQPIKVKRPRDRPTDYEGGAEAARELGLNRLAERLAKAQD